MDRAQATGFGISAAGHVALIAILSLGFAATRLPPPKPAPIEVSFVKDVGLTSAAPQPSPAPPAQSVAPEVGPPEEAAPAPAEVPKPPQPVPAPTPPKPAEEAKPARPAPKPAEKADKPAPAEKPASHTAPTRPAPAATRPSPAPQAGTASASRGSHLGANFLKGIGSDPTPSKALQPQAAAISALALASIEAAIQRQIQPCANRQVDPGPGANQIRVKLHLRLNPDGSLMQTPRVVNTSGVTAENGRYEDRVKDLAIAAYVGCAPLRDLPADLYQTPKGGWSDINMNYKLP